MKVNVKALSSFQHGRVDAKRGVTYDDFSKGEAEDLAKAGLVEIVGEDHPEPETKMQAPVENKMADAPANKRKKAE